MAYSDLNQNQTISLNNLQSGVSQGVFTAKTTIPSGTKQVTKAQVNTYVNVNTSLPSFVAKSSNQLVTKQDLSGITSTSPYLMYGVASYKGYKSLDGGSTWSELTGLTIYDLDWTAIAGDSTGTYIAAICLTQNNEVYISTNGGSNFTVVTLSNILIGFYPSGIAMSNNGQYITVSGYSTSTSESTNRNARIAVSNNYGSSFGAGSYTDGTGVNYYNPSGKVSVSGNGQYMTAVFAYKVDPGGVNVPRPWSFRLYSSNYGATWTKSNGSEFAAFFDIALDNTGQNQFLTSDWFRPGTFGARGIKAYVSNNYGSTWTERYSNTTPDYLGGSQNSGFVSATISDSGEVMVGATNGIPYFQGLYAPALPPRVITSFNYGTGSFASTDGYIDNIGIAGGTTTTTGITNNYIGMMLKNTGQFNYSVNGGSTFIPKASVSYPWAHIYRKAFLYTPSSNPAYGTYLYSECGACDLYAVRADGNGGTYFAEVIQYNSESCCFGGGGEV